MWKAGNNTTLLLSSLEDKPLSISTTEHKLRENTPSSDYLSSCSSVPLSPSSFSSSSFFSSSLSSSSVSRRSSLSSSTPESDIRKPAIPADSPLLTKPPTDSRRKRFCSFNKDLRRARRFRASREREISAEKSPSPCNPPPSPSLQGHCVTFLIKKSLTGKVGWKIMPEDDNLNLRMNCQVLEQVLTRIRDLQYSGQEVPSRMCLVVE
eukprot:GFUD01056167.1.p1 GENE.GFUD01056167.1~~GFUD01056167.1.p1  ORF type:complete len:230 (+),score=68.73 GFUD01056167.1:68-691(+)